MQWLFESDNGWVTEGDIEHPAVIDLLFTQSFGHLVSGCGEARPYSHEHRFVLFHENAPGRCECGEYPPGTVKGDKDRDIAARTVEVGRDDVVAVHVNTSYPCPFGCIFEETRQGRLILRGDCRMPESGRCHLRGNEQIKKLQAEADG